MEAKEPLTPPETASSPEPQTPAHSPWHSPVPYLFGGLAAVLALIAFALLFLACSYWHLSRDFEDVDESPGDGDLEAGGSIGKVPPPAFEEKIFVIMAGEVKPSFIATPASSRTSSFGKSSEESGGGRSKEREKAGMKVGGDDQVQDGNMERSDETSNQILVH